MGYLANKTKISGFLLGFYNKVLIQLIIYSANSIHRQFLIPVRSRISMKSEYHIIQSHNTNFFLSFVGTKTTENSRLNSFKLIRERSNLFFIGSRYRFMTGSVRNLPVFQKNASFMGIHSHTNRE